MKPGNLFITVLIFFTFLGSLQAKEVSKDTIQKQATEMAARLQLTEQQQAEFKKILLASMEKREQILSSYGIKLGSSEPISLSFSQKRKLRSELQGLAKDSQQKFSKVLNSQQMEQFEKLSQARRDEIRNEIQSRMR